MERFDVSIEQLNDMVFAGVVSIGIVGAVLALFGYGMGVLH